jgi:hypothetical protein
MSPVSGPGGHIPEGGPHLSLSDEAFRAQVIAYADAPRSVLARGIDGQSADPAVLVGGRLRYAPDVPCGLAPACVERRVPKSARPFMETEHDVEASVSGENRAAPLLEAGADLTCIRRH